MLRTRAAWPSCHPISATFTPSPHIHTFTHTHRGLTQTCLHGSTKINPASHLLCRKQVTAFVFCFFFVCVFCSREDMGGLWWQNMFWHARAPSGPSLLSVAIHHVRPLRAAVTLPRLSTRRQPEELKPRTWHLVCSTTAAKELLSKCTRSDVKYTRTFTSPVFAKAREGVSFAWLKGLVHRFFFFLFFTRRPPLYFLIPLFVNITEHFPRTGSSPTS